MKRTKPPMPAPMTAANGTWRPDLGVEDEGVLFVEDSPWTIVCVAVELALDLVVRIATPDREDGEAKLGRELDVAMPRSKDDEVL
jgi:hypothetical protein